MFIRQQTSNSTSTQLKNHGNTTPTSMMKHLKQRMLHESASKYEQKAWKEHISKYDFEKFKDSDLKRRFQILSVLGTLALNETRLAHFNKVKTNMKTVYGSGKV